MSPRFVGRFLFGEDSMKLLKVAALALFALLCAGSAYCQFPCTTSPNVGFQIPNIGNQTNWGTCLNTDLNMLDVLLGGTSTLTVSSLTPSVAGSTNWLTANTSPVAITNFTGGFPGQTIHVICGVGDSFTTISGSANITVSGAWSCATSVSISFTLVGTKWTEDARAGGGGGPGSGPTVQTNGINNAVQTVLNFQTSTTNASGLVATPSNPASTGIEKLEISGSLAHSALPALLSADIPNNAANTSGQSGTALALAATPSNCGANTAATGIAASGNAVGCFTPTGLFTS